MKLLGFVATALFLGGVCSSGLAAPRLAFPRFPNLLLPAELRQRDPGSLSDTAIARYQEKVERAVNSVLMRIEVPLPDLAGDGKIRPRPYFRHLQRDLEGHLKRTPGQAKAAFKIYASGGVVRSSITYLYDQIREETRANPEKSWDAILDGIIDAKEPIPAIKVRGVASDFDILIEAAPAVFVSLRERARALTDFASAQLGKSVESKTLQLGLFVMSDVRAYPAQIERSTAQGGSSVDYLAFEVGAAGKPGRMISPARFPRLFADLVRAHTEYAEPVDGVTPENPADTAIRGSRTRMEMPWIRMRGEARLKRDLMRTRDRLKSGELDHTEHAGVRALGQFDKMVRNSRYSGAHNLFYQGAPDSIEGVTLEIARLGAEKLERGESLIPEFVDSHSLESRTSKRAELNGLPRELIESDPAEFLKAHTRDGRVFHGTPSIENGLAILRQGLFVSRDGQGYAAFGRGAYSSANRTIAESYAGAKGIVFELEIPADPRLNILRWESVSQHPWMIAREAEAVRRGIPLFQLLSQEHGIDLILHQHLLIQNSAAIRLRGGIRSIAENHLLLAANPEKDLTTRLRSLEAYGELQTYATLTGDQDLVPANPVARAIGMEIKKMIQDASTAPDRLGAAIRIFNSISQFTSLGQIFKELKSVATALRQLEERIKPWGELALARLADPTLSVSDRRAAMDSYEIWAKCRWTALPKVLASDAWNRYFKSLRSTTIDHRKVAAERISAGLEIMRHKFSRSNPQREVWNALIEAAMSVYESMAPGTSETPDSLPLASRRFIVEFLGAEDPGAERLLQLMIERDPDPTLRNQALSHAIRQPEMTKQMLPFLAEWIRRRLTPRASPESQSEALATAAQIMRHPIDGYPLEQMVRRYAADPELKSVEHFEQALQALRFTGWKLVNSFAAPSLGANFQKFYGSRLLSRDQGVRNSTFDKLSPFFQLSSSEREFFHRLSSGDLGGAIDIGAFRTSDYNDFTAILAWFDVPGTALAEELMRKMTTPEMIKYSHGPQELLTRMRKNPETERFLLDFVRKNPDHPKAKAVFDSLANWSVAKDGPDHNYASPEFLYGVRELRSHPAFSQMAEYILQGRQSRFADTADCVKRIAELLRQKTRKGETQ